VSTINVILEPSADGTLHLPVPAEWRNRSIKVKAELEPLAIGTDASSASMNLKGYGCLKGKIRMSPDFDEPLEDFKEYMP